LEKGETDKRYNDQETITRNEDKLLDSRNKSAGGSKRLWEVFKVSKVAVPARRFFIELEVL
jgi:hypothetical protein